MSVSAWLCPFIPRPDARLRLVCFPHAGAAASTYFRWARALPTSVELVAVQYPGRAERLREPMPESMSDLVTGIVTGIRDALLPSADRPYALFGHSMGAAIAYETALALRAAGCPEPVRLIVSGRAPQGPGITLQPDLNDEQSILAALELFGGTVSSLLRDPEARAAFLPVFAADWRMLADYHPSPAMPPLTCPVSAMTGTHDPITDVTAVSGWSAATTGPFDLSVFPGDHFYLASQLPEVLALLSRLLSPGSSLRR